jgi:hypothetical protein
MSVESILRRKGTDVATIGPEASIKSAADWLRAKNIGALVVASGGSLVSSPNVKLFTHLLATAGESGRCR